MKLIDIHAHVNFPNFDADRGEVMKRALEAGVGMINVGTDLETSQSAVALAHEYENEPVWATVGLHPTDCQGATLAVNFWEEFKKLAQDKKVVAIGECGLDYFRSDKLNVESYKENQKQVFLKQIEIASEVSKPLMIHCRPTLATQDAYKDILEIISKSQIPNHKKNPGDLHFFAGSLEIAKQFLALGFTLSFTGVITFTHDYDEVIKATPLEQMMAETDCPFVAPVPYRGKRNEPSCVVEVVKRLAEIKEISAEAMAEQTVANAQRIFNLF
ncbi:MAG: TatD family hydrolase [Patescibacteria group bacterium]